MFQFIDFSTYIFTYCRIYQIHHFSFIYIYIYGNQTWPIKWNAVSSRQRSYRYWTLTKRLKKKLDGNYTWMLRAILNKSWRQHPTRHQLYGHLPPITKTIQVRRTRHAGHYGRSKDELISDVLLWTPTYSQAKAGRPARTYIQQLCEDTGCNLENLPKAMNDKEKWWERVRDIRAGGTTWWWWWWYIYTWEKWRQCRLLDWNILVLDQHHKNKFIIQWNLSLTREWSVLIHGYYNEPLKLVRRHSPFYLRYAKSNLLWSFITKKVIW